MITADVAIVGGGIVGLASGWQLVRARPELRVVVLEKEAAIAQHQTGRNSGVIHSGIYYKPGSLKARTCRTGKLALEEFCASEGVAYDICGKVVVAVASDELPALDRIYERGQANGVRCRMITREELHELEPHVAGVRAIHVSETGIVDYPGVCAKLADKIRQSGGEILTGARVFGFVLRGDAIAVQSEGGEVSARLTINCAGLHSDRVVRLSGQRPAAQVVPFRGEYYELKPHAEHLCRNLIYPTPDPKFPFLGVHFTRLVHGGIECGPNAVLAFAREGYRLWNLNPRDLFESLTYPGFLRMAAQHWRMGLGELWRSISKGAFVRALQRLMPEIQASDLVPAPSGVRAQLLGRDGNLVDDFLIQQGERLIHVCNAPSPAATASLEIGRLIAEQALVQL